MSEDLAVYEEKTIEPTVLEYKAPKLDLMNRSVIEQIERIADIMCHAKVTVPKHLVGSKADCFAIALQAAAWGMSPFAVAQKTHIVNGFLGYEAQLVNAVILSSKLISGRFKYEWDGIGSTRKCRALAVISGDDRATAGTWTEYGKQAVKNSPLWKSDPDQQLAYLAVKKWARLYCPDLIAGVYTPDEVAVFEPVSDYDLEPDSATINDAIEQQSEAKKGQSLADKATGKSTADEPKKAADKAQAMEEF